MADKDIFTQVLDKATDAIDAVSKAISAHAPEAWALAVKGVYAKGMSELIVGGFAFGMMLLSAIFFVIALKIFIRLERNSFAKEVSCVVMIIFGMISFIYIDYFARWISCFSDHIQSHFSF